MNSSRIGASNKNGVYIFGFVVDCWRSSPCAEGCNEVNAEEGKTTKFQQKNSKGSDVLLTGKKWWFVWWLNLWMALGLKELKVFLTLPPFYEIRSVRCATKVCAMISFCFLLMQGMLGTWHFHKNPNIWRIYTHVTKKTRAIFGSQHIEVFGKHLGSFHLTWVPQSVSQDAFRSGLKDEEQSLPLSAKQTWDEGTRFVSIAFPEWVQWLQWLKRLLSFWSWIPSLTFKYKQV